MRISLILTVILFGAASAFTDTPEASAATPENSPTEDTTHIEEASAVLWKIADTEFSQFQAEHTFPLNQEDWERTSKERFPATVPLHWDLWNRDNNHILDESEIRTGIEIAYGLRNEEGEIVRQTNGTLFYGRLFDFVDRDDSMTISRKEFQVYEQRYPDSSGKFTDHDRNNDGQLDRDEIKAENLFTETLHEAFQYWDIDQNQQITEEELRIRKREHEQLLTPYILPAFDTDGNASISLLEFALTPLAELNRTWNLRRTDVNRNEVLEPEEYFPPRQLMCSLLAQRFFNQLDLNQDGSLTLEEAAFQVDFPNVSRKTAFLFLDLDRDGELNQAEIFSIPRTTQLPDVLFAGSLHVYQQADLNQSNSLDQQEFVSADSLWDQVICEWTARTGEARFLKLDRDHSQTLTPDELTNDSTPTQAAELRWLASIFDNDDHEEVSLPEFLTILGARTPETRFQISCPIFDAAAAEIANFSSLIPQEIEPDHITRDHWSKLFGKLWFADQFELFDKNSDGIISQAETTFGFNVLHGIQAVSGELLRTRNGQVFNWRYVFLGWDTNRDGTITLTEFQRHIGADEKSSTARFIEYDTNADQQLSLDELIQIESLWIDVVEEFLRLDADQSGELDIAELQKGLPDWKADITKLSFPGFDSDGNQHFSLREYRSSPSGNLVVAWERFPDDDAGDGYVSLHEFHPRNGKPFLGLSRFMFQQLDRNQNGKLDIQEVDIDWTYSNDNPVLLAADQNNDGMISHAEVFLNPQKRTNPDNLARWHRFNENRTVDKLSPAWRASLARMIREERWVKRTIAPEFDKIDRDHNQSLSPDEVASTFTSYSKIIRNPWLFDFDGNREISFHEWSALQARIKQLPFGSVKDPIVDFLEEFLDDYEESLTNLETASKSDAGWIADQLPGFSPPLIVSWDQDADGQYTINEVRTGLEIAFGICHRSGDSLRTRQGEVFHARSFLNWDTDKNGMISHKEFLKGFSTPDEDEVFRDADRNGDGILSIEESRTISSLWKDQITEFLRFDRNDDLFISPEELSDAAHPWEISTSKFIFPGFDIDQDRKLSFTEFRWTPLANPMAFWERTPTDHDLDGFLTLQEFHPHDSFSPLGLSAILFVHLDLDSNGKLSDNELLFETDLKSAAPEVVFRLLDGNKDGTLDLTEVIHRRTRSLPDNAHPRQRHALISNIENQFYLSDTDQDGLVTRDEYLHYRKENVNPVTVVSHGGEPTGTRYPRRKAPSHRASKPEPAGIKYRFVLLITFNVFLGCGIGILFFKPAQKRS